MPRRRMGDVGGSMKLKDFAKTQPVALKNKVLALPVAIRKEVDEGIDEGVALTAISRWLQTKGYVINETSLRRHRIRRTAEMKGPR